MCGCRLTSTGTRFVFPALFYEHLISGGEVSVAQWMRQDGESLVVQCSWTRDHFFLNLQPLLRMHPKMRLLIFSVNFDNQHWAAGVVQFVAPEAILYDRIASVMS